MKKYIDFNKKYGIKMEHLSSDYIANIENKVLKLKSADLNRPAPHLQSVRIVFAFIIIFFTDLEYENELTNKIKEKS